MLLFDNPMYIFLIHITNEMTPQSLRCAPLFERGFSLQTQERAANLLILLFGCKVKSSVPDRGAKLRIRWQVVVLLLLIKKSCTYNANKT